MKYRKSSLFLVTLMVLAMLGAAFVSVPTVSAYTITVDGDPSDWLADASGQGVNTFQEYASGAWPYPKEYVWKDALDDDIGDGDYRYPCNDQLNPGKANATCDLLEWRATFDANNLYMLFKMTDVADPWSSPTGFSGMMIVVLIDQDHTVGSGQTAIPRGSDGSVIPEKAWEYAISLKGWNEIWNSTNNLAFGPPMAIDFSDWGGMTPYPGFNVRGSTTNDVIEVAIPIDLIGNPGQKVWNFMVFTAHEDSGNCREVQVDECDWTPGGGTADAGDFDCFDAAFYSSLGIQTADWLDSVLGNEVAGEGWEAIGFYNLQMGELYVGATADPNVYDPVNSLLPSVGTLFTVYIKTRNVSDLWTVEFYMDYDFSKLDAKAVRFGASWGPIGEQFLDGPGANLIDSPPGTIKEWDGGRINFMLNDTGDEYWTNTVNATIFEIDFNVTGTLPYDTPTILQIYCRPIVMLDGTEKPILVPKTDGKLWGKPRPPPGPPTAIIEESAPPYYVGDPITIWSESLDGWDGVNPVLITEEWWNITDSLSVNVHSEVTGRHGTIIFTPPYVDTFTVLLEVWAKPNPGNDYDNTTAIKVVYERKLTGIDCFTNKGRMWNYSAYLYGEGAGFPADAYTTDELVTLYAYVFYNGWPKAGFLVSFSVYSPAGLFVLKQNMTDQSGIAWIRFRIPTPTPPHLNYSDIFGRWYCFQKVRMSDEYYNDTVEWDVGWIVELERVFARSAYTYPEHMDFYILYRNIAMAPRNVIIEIEVYDDEDVPIAMRLIPMQIPGGELSNPYPGILYVECLAIPKWFYPGTGKVIVNAFMNALPIECGSCPCPPVSATFALLAPEVPPPDPGW